MNEIRKMNLQLFAGGAGGGAGGAGGGDGGAAGAAGPGEGMSSAPAAQPQQRRRSRGDDLSGVQYGVQTQEPMQTSGEGMSQPDDGATGQRMSFKDLIKSDSYKAEADEYIQGVVQSRLKSAKTNEALLGKAQMTLDRIAQRYGLDASDLNSLDFDGLNAAIDGDTMYLEQKAAENGVTVEVQKQLDDAARIRAMYQRQQAQSQQEMETRQAFANLAQQAEQMRANGFPNFDLRAEMENPAFRQMVMPPHLRGSGLSVEQAYAALHYKDMMGAGMQAAAQQARQNVSNAIMAGQQRPAENGTTTTRAVEVRSDPTKFTRQDRAEIRRRVAAGEKISFD